MCLTSSKDFGNIWAMGRLTEYFEAVQNGINGDNRAKFTHLDIGNAETKQAIKEARKPAKRSIADPVKGLHMRLKPIFG